MKWRVLTATLILMLLVVGCGAKPQEDATPTPIPTSVVPEKPTYVVTKGTVEKNVIFTARVSPLNERDLFFRSGGYVKTVYAQKGDWVEEGAILAELEAEELTNQLALLELDLENAQNDYNNAVRSNERQLFSAQMSLETTQLRLVRSQATPPISNLTSLKLSVQQAAEAWEEAKTVYKEALDRPWEPQTIRDSLYKNIGRAERSYQQIQAEYQVALIRESQEAKTYQIDLQLLENEVKRAEKELEWLNEGVDPALAQRVEAAQLKVDRIKKQLEDTQLIAPFAGEITVMSAIAGKAIEARKAVAVIADPSTVDITQELPTTQMSLLEEGMTISVTSSRYPEQVFEGLVQLMPYPYGTGGGEVQVEDMDQRTHMILRDANIELRVGDLVKVTVLVERSEGTLFLPPAAIRTFEGRRFVMVRIGDKLRKVDVKIGVEGEDAVEILSGLEEGQIVEGL